MVPWLAKWGHIGRGTVDSSRMYERRTHEYDALISKRYASIGEAFLFSDLFVLARPAFLHFIFPIIRSDRDPSWPIQLISDKD